MIGIIRLDSFELVRDDWIAVQDVVDSIRWQLSCIGITKAPSSCSEGVVHTLFYFPIGIGLRGIVKISHDHHRMWRVLDIISDHFRLFCPHCESFL